MSQVHVCSDAEALAKHACSWLVDLINARTEESFTLALSGGSTPKRLYQLLSELPEGTVPWSSVKLIWGDERNVAPDDAESNFRMVKESLLDHVDIPEENVIAVPDPGGAPESAAEKYATALDKFCGPDGVPVIDCVLLGMGDDVHTASLFPETQALDVTDRWVTENWVAKLNTWRITLTTPVLNAAKNVAFLIAGSGKVEALNTLWHGAREPHKYPSQLVSPRSGSLFYLVDEAALGSHAIPSGSELSLIGDAKYAHGANA